MDLVRQFSAWVSGLRGPSFVERYYSSSDELRLHYRDYRGPANRTPVLCIPGLTRNARDFDYIAARIAKTRRTLVADLRGRGKSSYAKDPRHYTVAVEAADMARLLADAGIGNVVILGTSRGGIVAMTMAATRAQVLRGVILNDIGGEIEARGLARILDFIGREPPIRDWQTAVAGLKRTYGASFPGVSDARWLVFARAIYREAEGRIVPDYDPQLGNAMRLGTAGVPAPVQNVPLWPLFGALSGIDTLTLRGENSDLLSAAAVAKMHAVKADLASATIANRGHAPFLDEPDAVSAIEDFLARVR
jgi:pimeloyl-ACP methyl ester carboxylesterase